MPEIFDMLRCGSNECCGGGQNSGDTLVGELLDFIRGDDFNTGQNTNDLFPQVGREGSETARGERSRPNRVAVALNTLSALRADPDPTPVTSIFPNPLQTQLPDRLSTGPQSFDELATFGGNLAFDDPTGDDLTTQIRRLLRNLG